MKREAAFNLIRQERAYQGEAGNDEHSIEGWINMMLDELYEADDASSLEEALTEIIQVAAIAVTCLEQYDNYPMMRSITDKPENKKQFVDAEDLKRIRMLIAVLNKLYENEFDAGDIPIDVYNSLINVITSVYHACEVMEAEAANVPDHRIVKILQESCL